MKVGGFVVVRIHSLLIVSLYKIYGFKISISFANNYYVALISTNLRISRLK